jgi:hypothetical protein
VNRAHLCFLLSLTTFLLFVLLAPGLSFVLFGSDTGEYARLTATLISTGHLPVGGALSGGYTGWGFAYPDFPGIFVVGGAVAQSFGVEAASALAVSIPAVAALAVVPLFLLFRRIVPSETIALLGAGFATVALPRAFELAHPAPVALGDFLAVGGLWMWVESRRDARWLAALVPVSGALIMTHHLSTYFFLVSAWGGLLVLELYRPRAWSRRFPLRELVFASAVAAATVLYWFEYAVDFRGVWAPALSALPDGLRWFGTSPIPALASIAVAALATGLLVHARRRRTFRWDREVRSATDFGIARDAAGLSLILAAGLVTLVFVPLPPTGQRIDPLLLVLYLPYLVLIPFTAASRRRTTVSRLAPLALAWLTALGASAIVGIATASAVLLPSRHAEFIVIPVGLLIAVGIGATTARWGNPARRRTLATAGCVAVAALALNAAIVYPPPSLFGGFQEGYTAGDAALWMWAGSALAPGTGVASDHRLSSTLFGFAGANATWQSTPALFVGTNGSAAALELCGSAHPRAVGPLRAVAVDETMRSTGVALDPAQPAPPMSGPARTWLSQPPFLPLYENGGETVYWVDASCPVPAL